jgi:hypothetical protein
MADISKCMDFLCPSKDKCYRFIAPVGKWQSYGTFDREEDAYSCSYFWEISCPNCGQKDGVHKLSCETRKIKINL